MMLAMSCGKDDPKQSLDLSPKTLTFAADATEAQTVTVDAKNVDWEFAVDTQASDWLSAERQDNTLKISVASDYTGADSRIGKVFVQAKGKTDLQRQEITVTQNGIGTNEFTLSATTLTFAGEAAPAQDVTVTVTGDKLTWTAAAEEASKSWITVQTAEGKITVSVSDNDTETIRTGNVIVTPNIGEPQEIFVKQEGIVLPPSLSVDEESLKGFNFKSSDINAYVITVTAVNCEWTTSTVDKDNNPVDWITLYENQEVKPQTITVTVKTNAQLEAREGFVVITPKAEGVDAIRIPVNQEAGRDHDSTLTEDIKITDLTHTRTELYLTTENEKNYASWNINMMSEGVDYNPESGWIEGTGNSLTVSLIAEYEKEGETYYISEGDYTMDPNWETDLKAMTIKPGEKGMNQGQYFFSYYMEYNANNPEEEAPLMSGTANVKRDGDTYTITMNLVDDGGIKVTATYTGPITADFISDLTDMGGDIGDGSN